MITLILAILSSTNITPTITIAVVLEITYILIRFLLIIFPKEHKFHKFLLRVFRGLKEIEDDITTMLPDPDEKDQE